MKALSATAICVSLLLGSPVHAQGTWPERPVRIIVPSPPGGGADAYARMMAAALSEALKAQFVVENRPGGNGNIGAEAAARGCWRNPAAPRSPTFPTRASPRQIRTC
jgi:tripartite-type tricarboxylate transporter receptor subunit TctC